jgi:hypothetical protein
MWDKYINIRFQKLKYGASSNNNKYMVLQCIVMVDLMDVSHVWPYMLSDNQAP